MATAATAPEVKLTGWRAAWVPRLREAKYGLYRFWQSKLAIAGLLLVLLYLIVALFAPVIAPQQDPEDAYRMRFDFSHELTAPGVDGHRFGTGAIGVDIFYGVVWGTRISMVMGLAITLAGALVGTILGGMAGYFGGKIDELIMRLTDVFLAMPVLILAMAISIAIPNEPLQHVLEHFFASGTASTLAPLMKIALAITITWWPSYTRLVRGTVLSIRENQYVEAARAVGASDWRIISRHILPNSLSPILVQMTLDIGSVVLLSAALSYIGFGPGGSSFAEWGNLVSQGQQYMQRAWWPVTIPGLAIFGFVLGFNLLGDGLRDLLDPRLRK